MIFLTVGTQLPFPRLVDAVNGWAADHPGVQIVGQVGAQETHQLRFDAKPLLPPSDVLKLAAEARLIVSHAGIGTVLTALRLSKPLLVMPRRASLGEHRNEHQLATARWLTSLKGVRVADDEEQLRYWLDNFDSMEPPPALADAANGELVSRLGEYVDSLLSPRPGHRPDDRSEVPLRTAPRPGRLRD